MTNKLIKSLGKKVVPLLTVAGIFISPLKANAEQSRNYLFAKAGYQVLGPEFSTFYNSNASYGLGIGRSNNDYGFEIGLNLFSTDTDLKKIEARGFISSQSSLETRTLDISGINARINFKLSQDISLYGGALVQNAKVSNFFLSSRRSFFSSRDTTINTYGNLTMAGYNAGLEIGLIKEKNYDFRVEIGTEQTQAIEQPDLRHSGFYIQGKLNFYFEDKRNRRKQ
ncbi:MAG: hypothetical protein AABW41_02580 [Nanoarchaeota archaeon]